MQTNDIKNYRQVVTLKDGANILLRPAQPEDSQRLIGLYQNASTEDIRYLRGDVKDPAVVQSWLEDLDYNRVIPLLAMVQDRVVGNATLHFRTGPERHIGELRIFLTKDLRRRGLGTRMLQTLIELARKQNLYLLIAKVVANQSKVIKAFQKLGFEHRCTFEDYFILPDGELLDLVFLTLYLREDIDEF